MLRRARIAGLIASLGWIGCGGGECPEGSIDEGGRCRFPDAAVIGVDAPLPDVFVPEGVDAGELPDVFVALPDAFVVTGSDGCVPAMYFVDADEDGHGDPATGAIACEAPAGSVALGDDCDDDAMEIHPGATEACDGIDQDCDTRFDEGAGPIAAFYVDADGDHHGAPGSETVMACAAPTGRAALPDDCDDTRATVFPGATEACNGGDDDCDGASDEGLQRPLRSPHEIVPVGGVTSDLVWSDAMGDGYVIAYRTSTGAYVQRVARDGTLVGTARMFAGTNVSLPRPVATSATRAAIVYSRLVSGVTYSQHAVSVDFSTTPPTVSAEITIASATNTLGPTAAVLEGRLVVLWLAGGAMHGRTYALDLTDASADTTLAGLPSSGVLLAGDGGSWVGYTATPAGGTSDECYVQRLTVSPLAATGTVTTLGDGTSQCALFVAATAPGRAQAMMIYGDGARFENVELTLGATAAITRRATAAAIAGPFAFTVPGVAGSRAGLDFTYATAPGTPPTLGQHVSVAAGGTMTTPMSFGGAAEIASLELARSSSQHGAAFFAARPTGGAAGAFTLQMQEVGCE